MRKISVPSNQEDSTIHVVVVARTLLVSFRIGSIEKYTIRRRFQ